MINLPPLKVHKKGDGMITLGYMDPVTHEKVTVEVGRYDEERGGYWALRINPETLDSIGEVFFAEDKDLF
jgi:hypothetical protein